MDVFSFITLVRLFTTVFINYRLFTGFSPVTSLLNER